MSMAQADPLWRGAGCDALRSFHMGKVPSQEFNPTPQPSWVVLLFFEHHDQQLMLQKGTQQSQLHSNDVLKQITQS